MGIVYFAETVVMFSAFFECEKPEVPMITERQRRTAARSRASALAAMHGRRDLIECRNSTAKGKVSVGNPRPEAKQRPPPTSRYPVLQDPNQTPQDP